MNFTGIRDVDLEILKKLDDAELGKICSTNKYFRDLCKNEDFWRNRTVERFSKYLGNVEAINKYRLKANLTWRLYYISLIDYLESFYQRNVKYSKRDDLQIINKLFRENFQELLDEINNNFDAGKWKDILKRELLVPNSILFLWDLSGDYEPFVHTNDHIYAVVDYALSNIEKIDPNVVLSELLINHRGIIPEELKSKLIERIFKDDRIKVESVLNTIKDFVDVDRTIDYDINKYLDFVKEKGKIEELRIILGNQYNKEGEIFKHIYDYLDKYIDSSLPEILKTLEEKSLSKLQQDAILSFIKNM